MKQINIAGNIGKSAETRQAGDTTVTSWSVAVEGREGRETVTIWFDVSLWGKRGEVLAQYLIKGNKVAICGDLGTREHNGKTYLTVRADQVTLMGGKPSSEERQTPTARGSDQAQRPDAQQSRAALDDEIPF